MTHLPLDSSLMRDLHGSDAEWSLDNQLRAATVDGIRLLLWQNTDPKKKVPQPQPIPRPGVKKQKGRRIAGDGMGRSAAEVDAILAMHTEPAAEEVTDVS